MLIAGMGGFIGTCTRFLAGRIMTGINLFGFPAGTFAVNLAGCFLIGLLTGYAEKTQALSKESAVLLITGFCGGFTTFSTYASEIWNLGSRQEWVSAISYLLASIILGVALVGLGRHVIR